MDKDHYPFAVRINDFDIPAARTMLAYYDPEDWIMHVTEACAYVHCRQETQACDLMIAFRRAKRVTSFEQTSADDIPSAAARWT